MSSKVKVPPPSKGPGGGAPAPSKKCPDGQEFVLVKGKCMVKCKPGKERNPKTGRCIISRKINLKLKDNNDWRSITGRMDFNIPSNSSFKVKVLELVNYTCSYFD